MRNCAISKLRNCGKLENTNNNKALRLLRRGQTALSGDKKLYSATAVKGGGNKTVEFL